MLADARAAALLAPASISLSLLRDSLEFLEGCDDIDEVGEKRNIERTDKKEEQATEKQERFQGMGKEEVGGERKKGGAVKKGRPKRGEGVGGVGEDGTGGEKLDQAERQRNKKPRRDGEACNLS